MVVVRTTVENHLDIFEQRLGGVDQNIGGLESSMVLVLARLDALTTKHKKRDTKKKTP